MYIKLLRISTENKIIREIHFHKGLNLIVDESNQQVTGNNVGKTTVLKLIDLCLGGHPKDIYVDPENLKSENLIVKNFLFSNNVIITLVLGSSFDVSMNDICIRRNFLGNKSALYEINGEKLLKKDFISHLSCLLFPKLTTKKPSFRQLISHNIRYHDYSLSNVLKTLTKFTKDVDYESLYLFMFGCETQSADERQHLLEHLREEKIYKVRIEKIRTKNECEATLDWLSNRIDILNDKKSKLNINENFERDLNKLNSLKYSVNSLSSEISVLNIRKGIILDAKKDFESQKSDIDLVQLKSIYSQASSLIPQLQKKFDELVAYHNTMLTEKSKFITQDLPQLELQLNEKKIVLSELLKQEKELSEVIKQSDTFEELEIIIDNLNDLYRQKGECDTIIKQLDEIKEKVDSAESQLQNFEENLFSDSFEMKVKVQLKKFNVIFSRISEKLYGEPYSISYSIKTNKDGHKVYTFNSIQVNHSSGLKQGEISCFDIAYILFADQEKMSCLHFILNDKKELVHDNQLIKIAEIVASINIQFIASILNDKLPPQLNSEKNFILKLSQNDKLFRIENN